MKKAKAEQETKKQAGVVCILHGTQDGGLRCAVCEGYRANGTKPGLVCGCGNTIAFTPRRRFAFTAVLVTEAELRRMSVEHGESVAPPGAHWMVGRADEGTRGYSPLPHLGLCETEREARRVAERLNRTAGWSDVAEPNMLVLSTMTVQESHLERLLRRGLELMKKWVATGIENSDDDREWIEEVEAELRPRK